MKLVNMIKVIKQIHPEDLVLLKVGSFYHAYGKDAYIIAYLFNYQMKKVDNKYAYYYSIAHKYISKKTRINEIYQYLLENIAKDNMKEKNVIT